MHQNDVDRQAMKPCGKGRVAAKRRDFAMELQKGFLREVFGLGNIPHHAQTERINSSLVQGVEMGKCVMVARLRPRQNLGLGESGGGTRYLGCRVASWTALSLP